MGGKNNRTVLFRGYGGRCLYCWSPRSPPPDIWSHNYCFISSKQYSKIVTNRSIFILIHKNVPFRGCGGRRLYSWRPPQELQINYHAWKMRALIGQWFWHKITVKSYAIEKKIKSWGPFWIYQLISTNNPAQSYSKRTVLAVLVNW